MGDVLRDARACAWATLLVMVGAVVAMVVPSLLMTASDATGSLTTGVLALALAALVQFARRSAARATRTLTAVRPTGDEVPLTLSGRVTDPVHHPLRPRAPGLG